MTQLRDQTEQVELSDRMREFLDEVKPAIVGTARRNGTIQLNPIWYDRDGNRIRINPASSRNWGKRLDQGSEVTLLFVDPANQFRWAEVRGRVLSKTLEGGEEHIDTLSRRYFGQDYGNHDPDDPRLLVIVEPTHVFGSIDGEWG